MNKVAVLYIALGRYTVFFDEFYESCEQFLTPCKKHYFVWTDNPTPAMRGKNITVIPAQKKGWPYDSLLRFEMFLEREKEILESDYTFFFNANFKFYNPVDLAEIIPMSWHNGLMASIHPGTAGSSFYADPDSFPYERRPESTAYIPFGSGKYYVCGAFNGGTSTAFMKMCHTLTKNVRADLKNDIVAKIDDESHLNAYLSKRNFRLCGRAYGFPEGHIKNIPERQRVLIKLISRAKDTPKYGGTKYLRGQTDQRLSNGPLTHIKRQLFRIIALFIPTKRLRSKIRAYGW